MKLSKLELRAKVIDIIKKFKIVDSDILQHDLIVNELSSLENRELVVQTLIKELNTDDDEIIQKVSMLLLDLNSLEYSKEPLWEYIKSPDVSDRVKEASCILLKSLGDKITSADLLNYMDDPNKLIDAETEKLLETALSNPEAQIDLIDFMFAVGKEEQISLIESLVSDYPGDSLANILGSILESMEDTDIKELAINILGETKSDNSVAPLLDVIEYSDDENLKKLAKKSLNKIKLLGIKADRNNIGNRGETICRGTQPYKFFATYPDGVGNQCVVTSRINEDGLISVSNTIINDLEGVVDCFGFYLITEFDFDRIISRLENQSDKVEISAEYAKFLITKAEMTNKTKQFPMPYEYSCWKYIVADISGFSDNIDEKVSDWANQVVFADYREINKSNVFNSWFFEEGDNEGVEKMIELSFEEVNKSHDGLIDKFEEIISENFLSVFDDELVQIYHNRLKSAANLFDINGEIALRNSSSFIAKEIINAKLEERKKIDFLKNILKKSIMEAFLRELSKYNVEENVPQNIFSNQFSKVEYKLSKENLNFVIDLLEEKWS